MVNVLSVFGVQSFLKEDINTLATKENVNKFNYIQDEISIIKDIFQLKKDKLEWENMYDTFNV